ncbi:unnamed protein product [Penicillium manginii]
MKYQNIASLGFALLGGAATVSASPLILRGNSGVCPKGYSPTVITMTVPITATPSAATSTAVVEEPTSTSSTPAPVTETQTPVQIETSTPVGYVAALPSSVAPTTEAAVPVTTQASVPETTEVAVPETSQAAVVVTTSSSQAPVVNAVVATTSSVAEETTTSQAAAAQSTQVSTKALSSSSSSSGSSGEATFYGGNVAGGTCSFSGYTLPSNLFGTAFSGAVWDDASKCGSCVAVTGPNGKTIKAMVVDKCPECASGHFDLFQDAFAELSDISAGVIDITYSAVSCDLEGPLKLKNKEGTSEYWFSMQVVNANEPVTKFEVSTDGGSSWTSTTRTDYNYFEHSSGFGTDSVTVRVTGESGTTVVVKNVGCTSGSEITAGSNL